MHEAQLDFYFDIFSPFAYLAYQILKEREHTIDARINYRPVCMAAIFKATKNVGPVFIPQKFAYLSQDVQRMADFWRVEQKFVVPDWFGQFTTSNSSLLTLRVLCLIQKRFPEDFDAALKCFWSRIFVEHKTNCSPDDIVEVLAELGLPKQLLARAANDDARSLLRDNITSAVKDGAFGVPYMVLKRPMQENQSFFGVESIPMLFHSLNTHDGFRARL